MKIRCDVCEKQEAHVFCCADEAVLCGNCDWRVHNVNKLASRHKRYTLFSPNSTASKKPSVCDICQEKRALLFCQEDRAILCRDCDLCTHKANEFTQKHNRYLLTGVQISSSSPSHVSHNNSSADTNVIHGPEEIPMSSITEYLLDTLPGWQVDDFLGPAPPSSYCKKTNDVEEENASPNSSFGHLPYYYGAEKFANRNSSKWSDTGYTVPDVISSAASNEWRLNQQ